MIFIAGPHKSGSTLVRNLLDGHEELAVVPFETHLARCFALPLSYRLSRSRASRGQPLVAVEAIIKGYLEGKERTADADLSGFLTEEVIDERSRRLPIVMSEEIDAKSVRSFLTYAYYLATGCLPGERRLVEKSVEHVELVPDLLALDPAVQVIQIRRNQGTNLASLRRTVVSNRGIYPPIRPLAEMLVAANRCIERNEAMHGHRVMTIDYERLVADRRQVMKQIARFLNIDKSQSLFQPTSMGKPWAANSSVERKAAEHLKSRRARSEGAEVLIEGAILGRVDAELVNVKSRISTLASCLRPAYKERPPAYILNRLAVFGGDYV